MLYFLDSKKWVFFFLFGFSASLLFSQGQGNPIMPLGKIGLQTNKPVRLSALNNRKLLQEELEKRKKGINPSFAVSRNTSLVPSVDGKWVSSADGRHEIWQLRIQSPGALSLNLGISDFYLTPNAKMWIYNPSMSQVEGPFSYEDNELHGQMWTPAIQGNELIIEVFLPTEEKKWLKLKVEKINHDFQGIFSFLSGSCNLDVACGSKEGWKLVDNYRDIMRAVGMFTINGRNFCSGALINNGRNDCKPYFLSAFHCDVTASNAASVVVYWNFQNSACRPLLSPINGGSGDGKKSIFNSGAYFRAGYAPSDFILLELDDPVQEAARPFFAGWDATPILPKDTLVCLHHPNTQEKRISISFRKAYRGQWGQMASEVPNGNHLIIPKWDVGTTEDGSSGGPLINKNQQIVGQLHGGSASCSNNAFDAFGWFYSSWIGGGSPINRLSEWLDPGNIGFTNMVGREGVLCKKGLATSLNKINICVPDIAKIQIFAGTAFSKLIVFDIVSTNNAFSYSFNPMVIPPGGVSTLTFSAKQISASSENLITVRGISGTDTVFTDVFLTLNRVPENVVLRSEFTNQEIEPKISWSKWIGATDYEIEIANDSIFEQVISQTVTSDTFTVIKGLNYAGTYYFRMKARNECGQSQNFTTRKFLTPLDLRFQIVDLNNILCLPSDLKAGLKIGVGFEKPVKLKYTIVPPLPTWQFNADDANNNLLILNATAILDSLKAGFYQVKIVVSDTKNTAEANFNFQLKGLPPKPTLLFPDNGEVLLTARPQLSWSNASLTDSYLIRVSKDLPFKEIIYEGERNLNFYKFAQDLNSGTYYWQIIAKNDCGIRESDVRKFKLTLNDLGSLFRWQIAVEPNPATDFVNIHISEKLQDIRIDLYSMQGRLLFSQHYLEENNHFSIRISSFPTGMYMVRIFYKQGSFSKQIIKHAF